MTKPDYKAAGHKLNHYKRLKLIKCILLLGSTLSFTVFRRTDVSMTLQFLWSCFVAQTHDQPVESLYDHFSYAVINLGPTLVDFLFVMIAIYFVYFFICLIWPAEDEDENYLEYLCREAEKSYKQRIREARLYETAEDTLEQNIKLRSQLGCVNNELLKLQDRLVKIKLEISAIEIKQRGKTTKKSAPDDAPDLFKVAPYPRKLCDEPQSRAIKRKWGISRRPRNTPEF